MFTRNDLDELVVMDARPAVSLYLPTHVAENLLSAAAERLPATWRRPAIEDFLGPAESLVGDKEFWRHQQQGLAVFLAPGFNRIHKLPTPVPEEIFLGDQFHIKPLLRLLEDAGLFWLLTISAKHTRLYRASRWEFAEDKEIDLPQGVGKIRGMTDYEETQYASPMGQRGTLAHARVDTLFPTGDDHLWGWFDESGDRVVAHGSAADGDIDLLDFTARMTLRQGGLVTLVAREALPPPGLSAAILRY
jgi:hypothetical protein